MKAYRLLLCVSFIVLIAVPLTAENDTELRQAMIDASGQTVQALATKEVSPGLLGDWSDTINTTLFMLVRRTEIFRGRMRILVIDNTEIQARLYPDATFVLSTGLLDYIDNAVFTAAAGSARRIRNIGNEREDILVPFLVTEIAEFALDQPFTAYKRTVATNGISQAGADFTNAIRPSAGEIYTADSFSKIILKLAGYDPNIFDSFLSSLDTIRRSGKDDPGITAFSSWLSGLPSPANRVQALADAADATKRHTGEFRDILAGLRGEAGLDQALSAVSVLQETYPASLWLLRLNALACHEKWLSSVSVQDQILKVILPLDRTYDDSRTAFLELLEATDTLRSITLKNDGTQQTTGDASLYTTARNAYETIPNLLQDAGVASAYAVLLAYGGNQDSINAALKIAEQAATAETGASCVARANYASLLALSGSDPDKALYLIDFLNTIARDSESAGFVTGGYPGDGRDILLNKACMLKTAGKKDEAGTLIKQTANLIRPSAEKGLLALRRVHIGDSADDLLAKWGKPAEIVYNIRTETWTYPGLSASVLIRYADGKESPGKIDRIYLKNNSPISVGDDTRVGDKKIEFENIFGKPVYRTGDYDVYLFGGNRIAVLYLSEKIRSITIGI